MEKLTIDNRIIGPGEPPYIIAEIGANHNGDMSLCKKLIDSAKMCGVDAVKFQSWQKNTINSKALYESNKCYDDKKRHFGSLEEMDDKYQLTFEQHFEVKEYCDKKNITFLSTGFSKEQIDLLEDLNVPAYKIASMDINYIPLLQYIASKHKPVILSTGMASLGEIERAIYVLKEGKAGPIALLHCISIYPPAYDKINLLNMNTLRKAFDVPVGFSDHSLGTAIPLAGIALGASIIEKHFTLDKSLPGWDHEISADPTELDIIVHDGYRIFLALGNTVRVVNKDEIEKRKKFRRCIVMKRSMQRGEIIRIEDLDFKRPGTGIHPDETGYVIGRVLLHDIESEDELKWSDFS